MDRTIPPASVRKALRREIGFVCPVDGCGSPYLTWHHFDPPWRVLEHHDPSGMIALCLQHHAEADSGAFSSAHLRKLKSSGDRCPIRGRFNWKREQLILEAGGGLYIRCPVLLEVGDRPMIWLTSDSEGNQLLNLDIWDSDGQLAFSMRDNDWIVVADLDDLEAPPSARSLVVRAPKKGIRLSIEFTTSTLERIQRRLRTRQEEMSERAIAEYAKHRERLVQRLPPGRDNGLRESLFQEMSERQRESVAPRVAATMESIKRGCKQTDFVICTLGAKIPFPPIHITQSRIKLPGNNTISFGVVIDCGTAIKLG
jgi:hypothetical protein